MENFTTLKGQSFKGIISKSQQEESLTKAHLVGEEKKIYVMKQYACNKKY